MSRDRQFIPTDDASEDGALIRGPAKNAVVYVLGAVGSLSMALAIGAFGFAWNTSERLARAEERLQNNADSFVHLRGELREMRTRLDQILDELRRRP